MIIVGGENIYPSEVENIIPKLKGIYEAVLSSIPHDILGEELVFIYKLDSNAIEPNVKNWKKVFNQEISSFKIPKKIIDINQLGLNKLPRAHNGKILRKQIKDILQNYYSD